jgi:hypothetical protein
MHLLKYTEGWTRRHFLEQTAKGIVAAGVLAPLFDTIANTGSCEAAYPPELLSIEAYTKGKLKEGQELNAENVDLVKDILDPITYWAFKHDGLVADLVPQTRKADWLVPKAYLDATFHNQGKFKIFPDGNLYTLDHKPWTGGAPFPKPTNALEILYSNVLAWSKQDSEMGCVHEWNTDADGNIQYEYESFYVEYLTVGRLVNDPKPYLPGHESQLRYSPAWLAAPEDTMGTSFLQIFPYDQRLFPEFYGYLPLLKRTRTFPNNQRFEPQLPGETTFASDAWMTGDPLLTWGDFKIIGKGPLLGGVHGNSRVEEKGWLLPTCGGKTGKKYFRAKLQLIPECYICELSPTHYPRAPISKKRIWFDARTIYPFTMVAYDRQGKPWQLYQGGGDAYRKTPNAVQWNNDLPDEWVGWSYFHSMDIQSRRMTRAQIVPEIQGGYKLGINQNRYLEEYCSMDALRRLGR